MREKAKCRDAVPTIENKNKHKKGAPKVRP